MRTRKLSFSKQLNNCFSFIRVVFHRASEESQTGWSNQHWATVIPPTRSPFLSSILFLIINVLERTDNPHNHRRCIQNPLALSLVIEYEWLIKNISRPADSPFTLPLAENKLWISRPRTCRAERSRWNLVLFVKRRDSEANDQPRIVVRITRKTRRKREG